MPRSRAFHDAALLGMEPVVECGDWVGYDRNGKPGLIRIINPDYHAAFVFDPDGQNSEAVYPLPEGSVSCGLEIR
ncbi:hypothetical protein ACFO1V_15120 [Daeguia caeni]|uniref:DUF4926 domain-containing protein n=1 Tax=Daeguia caeni TaxID=439612 RepID=A0ABV9H825_9HYPH